MSWDDDFFKKSNFPQFDSSGFDRIREDFDKQRENFQRTHDTLFNDHRQKADESFDTAQTIFFAFFGIVLTIIIAGFVLTIFLICYRLIKGRDFPLCRGNTGSTATTCSLPTAMPTSCNVHNVILNFIHLFLCIAQVYSIPFHMNQMVRQLLRIGFDFVVCLCVCVQFVCCNVYSFACSVVYVCLFA